MAQHHHGAGGGTEYSGVLERMNRFQEPEVRQAIADLQLPMGSYGLDVGCGVGLYALWLAEAIGPQGRVLGFEPQAERVTVPSVRWATPRRPDGWSSVREMARRFLLPINRVIGCGVAMCCTISPILCWP